MKALDLINIYISFFEKRGHKRIPGAALVPENDPTTLFTSSGMQPLVPYLLGEPHPAGKRLVNVQNAFRAVDIEEVGNNRHTTFFRMLGNWSLGDYFKKEQLPWVFELLTKELGLDTKRLYFSVFEGDNQVKKDEESAQIWKDILSNAGLDPKERIFYYGVDKNWWSRSGTPDKMPAGEPGGPDSEVFYDFGPEFKLHENSIFSSQKCHPNCDCGRYWEIANSVFMQYKKHSDGTLKLLHKPNVDFGGGLERLVGATENQPDVFITSLFKPIIQTIENITQKSYPNNKKSMQIIADHFVGSCYIAANGVKPSNKEQGYILRRHIRRGLDNLYMLKDKKIEPVLESIVGQYGLTDQILVEKYEEIKDIILEEEQVYKKALSGAKKFIEKEYSNVPINNEGVKLGDELMGIKVISAEVAFKSLATYGLSPVQLESLGYMIDDKQKFANLVKEHQDLSRAKSAQKFSGGLADHQEKTIKGHTATHLLQQALRDILGHHVFQTGSNITTERLRFDFSHPDKLTSEQIEAVGHLINGKIKENLPVHFEMLPLEDAKRIGAIGLFDEKYHDKVKIYFIGGSGKDGDHIAYSKEFCGGPHVNFTGEIKSFEIIKNESIGKGQQRIYAVVS